MDVAATIAHRTGTRAPARSVGSCLLCGPASPASLPPPAAPVVVVLPAHNEEHTVRGVVGAVPSTVGGHPVEVVVVDDGSSDDTAALALAAGAKVVVHERRRGLGAAVRTGLEEARRLDAAAVAFLDADGEYDPSELPAMVEPILDGAADYVVGSRFAGTIEAMRWHRRAGNHLFTVLTSVAARRRVSDGQSGFRALGRDALAHARIVHDYNYAQVLTLDLLATGFRYAEVPIRYHHRMQGSSFVRVVPYLTRVLPAMVRLTLFPQRGRST